MSSLKVKVLDAIFIAEVNSRYQGKMYSHSFIKALVLAALTFSLMLLMVLHLPGWELLVVALGYPFVFTFIGRTQLHLRLQYRWAMFGSQLQYVQAMLQHPDLEGREDHDLWYILEGVRKCIEYVLSHAGIGIEPAGRHCTNNHYENGTHV